MKNDLTLKITWIEVSYTEDHTYSETLLEFSINEDPHKLSLLIVLDQEHVNVTWAEPPKIKISQTPEDIMHILEAENDWINDLFYILDRSYLSLIIQRNIN